MERRKILLLSSNPQEEMTQKTLTELYKINFNPFDPEEHVFPAIGRTLLFNKIQRDFNDYVNSKACQMVAITGEYGMGKSFTLIDLEQRIKKGKVLPEKKVFCVRFRASKPKPPANYFVYIFRQTIMKLGFKVFQELRDEVTKKAKAIGKSDETFLDNLERNFKSAFLKLKGENARIAWRWITGQNLAPSLRGKLLDVEFNITNEDVAKDALFALLKLLNLLDYDGLILLIDEFEYVFAVAGLKKAYQFVTTYKDIYDDVNEMRSIGEGVTPIIFVFACSDATWELLKRLVEQERSKFGGGGLAPFFERIKEEYALRGLTETETRKLVVTRLDKARVEGLEAPYKLFPFEPSCARSIYVQSDGHPRRIISRCRYTIRDCFPKAICPINQRDFEEVLSERGLLIPMEEVEEMEETR